MQTLSVKLPDFMIIDKNEVKFIIATHYYKNAKLSLGQAAELISVSKRTFMELLGKYGISVFNENIDEIAKDFENA